jgi:RNA polymerase primary sigma factor/RNA polymerase nonessential primary-like sigma factor
MYVDNRAPRRASQGDLDLAGRYLGEVGTTPLLTAEQEVELAKRIEAGVYAAELLRAADTGEGRQLPAGRRAKLRVVAADGCAAKDHMVRANLRLVVSVAKKHAYRGLPLLDVIQEGNLGLIRAVEKFDYAKGYKFSTYAVWWIRQAIDRGLAEQLRTVRLPVQVVEELSKFDKAERRLGLELGRAPTVEELAGAVHVPATRIVELRNASRSVISLETPLDDGGSSVADLIQDADAGHAFDAVEHDAVAAELRALVQTLPPRQAKIIAWRYGLTDGRARTLQEVADELGLTRERIRQLEKASMGLLRDPDRNAALLAWAS